MAERNTELPTDRAWRLVDRHWKWLVVAAWALFCGWFVYSRWGAIQGFALGDTDDNLRMSQVRALLAGQDWFDLRQYRLNPPAGANIHWSRLVDLPLAALILLLRPLVGGADVERVAVTIAPLLPLLILLFALSLTVRRLVDKCAFPLAFAALFLAGSTQGMFMPLRIDHHGWQLALLAVAVAAMADPKRARGGATLGIATALSLAIGLELLIYLALAGVATVLMWIDERDQRRRLAAYAVTLAGGTALSFLAFASYANRAAVCDALSPVWLSDALLGGALLLGLAMLSPADWTRRLALAAAAGVAVAAFHALAWPHCMSRLEGVSPEVQQLWLSHVR
ncbi:MAG: AcrB/AcrD/AcrF family protein, partial [Sphingomicrobium sp.]